MLKTVGKPIGMSRSDRHNHNNDAKCSERAAKTSWLQVQGGAAEGNFLQIFDKLSY
jgi:hypothetical protein